MDKFPVEVLHRIFIQLHIRQRIECTLVCRLWTRVLHARSLYHTVMIENQLMCSKFLEMIERFPRRARHVEHLELASCFGPHYDKRKMCTIFPNLRIIRLTSEYTQDACLFRQTPVDFIFPDGQIEELADYEECELAYELIASGLCSRLTTLNLDINFERDSFVHFIPSLKNLPALKKLITHGLVVRIDDMETIHTNLPSLEVLELNRCKLKRSILPLDIKHSTLKRLKILFENGATFKNRHDEWKSYILNKYPSLTELSIWSKLFGDREFEGDLLDTLYILYPYRCKSELKSLGPICCDSLLVAHHMFDMLTVRLKTLKLEFKTQPLNLDFLTDSPQTKSIEELHLTGITSSRLEFLSNMTNLKKLHLIGTDINDEYDLYPNLSLGDLMLALSNTVDTLCIENFWVSLSSEIKCTLTSIIELNLKNVRLMMDFNKVIGDSFPALKILRINNSLSTFDSIKLKNHDLSLLDITPSKEIYEMIDVDLTTMNNNVSRYFPVKLQFFFSQHIQPDLYIDYSNPDYRRLVDRQGSVSVTCNSVKTLIVNKLVYPSQ